MCGIVTSGAEFWGPRVGHTYFQNQHEHGPTPPCLGQRWALSGLPVAACLVSIKHRGVSPALLCISLMRGAFKCLFTCPPGLGVCFWTLPVHILHTVGCHEATGLEGGPEGWAGFRRMEAICLACWVEVRAGHSRACVFGGHRQGIAGSSALSWQ